jgi:hypothetical protein
MTVRMLALRQPMAQDLREVVAAIKIASDIERIGDYAKNIAKRAIVLSAHAAAEAGGLDPAHEPAGAAHHQGRARRLHREGRGRRAGRLAARRRSRRDV